jgi:hypothetical protein
MGEFSEELGVKTVVVMFETTKQLITVRRDAVVSLAQQIVARESPSEHF